jgi:hypothetical protein
MVDRRRRTRRKAREHGRREERFHVGDGSVHREGVGRRPIRDHIGEVRSDDGGDGRTERRRLRRRENDPSLVSTISEWESHDQMHEAIEKYDDQFNKEAGTADLRWTTHIWHRRGSA